MEHLLEWGEPEDKDRMRTLVMEWGYPRWIDDDEMVVSAWFTYGPGIFWLHIEDGYEDELLVHCCEPESDRGRPLARDWVAVVKTIAQLWGFEWIRVWVDPEEMDCTIARYLIRLGFTPDHRGLRCPSWGSSDGKSAESSEASLPTSG